MSNIKNSFKKSVFMALSLCFVFTVAYGATLTPAQKLEKGKELYEQGKYDDAMDNFVDVFVSGNAEQISEANEYVNMIHFKRGGVEAPKQVPYDSALEEKRAEDSGHSGKVLFDPAGYYNKDNADNVENKPVKTEKTPVAAATAAEEAAEETEPAEEVNEPVIYRPDGTIVDSEKDVNSDYPEKIYPKSNMPSDDDEELRELRAEAIDKQIASMNDDIIKKLSSFDGVNVYMRGGGVDAIDIESRVLFANDGINFKPEAKEILDYVYSLMILNGTPSFILLPPGSYSDEVSIGGVRQTIALNSYLINMGISSAKLSFNMGLTTEEPPAKFSNLEGISIVFDYTAEPNLTLKSPDKDLPPVLSLGLYPFRAITPEKDEGMVVDFSVMQSSDKVADWALQIIQHAKDGKYYVVRQISGEGPVYRQIFWNGKKQYFGQILPLGNYTIILRAMDVEGREKVVRRKVELLGEKKAAAVVKKAAKQAVKKNQPSEDATALDYSTPRLWKKPSATAKSGAGKVENDSNNNDDYVQTEQPAFQPNEDSFDFGYDAPAKEENNNTDAGQYDDSINMPNAQEDNSGIENDIDLGY